MVQIDMNKPPECAACPMCSYEDDSCLLQPFAYRTWDEQYEHCPLVEAIVEELEAKVEKLEADIEYWKEVANQQRIRLRILEEDKKDEGEIYRIGRSR